jgi:hypothetical protein
MEANFGDSGLPGMGPVIENSSRQFLKDGTHKLVVGIRIDKDTQDVDNDPVTKLRPGLVLVRVEGGDNDGHFVHLDHADAPDPGDVLVAVILMGYRPMLNREGEVEDKQEQGLVHGIVDEAQIIWGTDDEGTIDALKEVMRGVIFWTDPS